MSPPSSRLPSLHHPVCRHRSVSPQTGSAVICPPHPSLAGVFTRPFFPGGRVAKAPGFCKNSSLILLTIKTLLPAFCLKSPTTSRSRPCISSLKNKVCGYVADPPYLLALHRGDQPSTRLRRTSSSGELISNPNVLPSLLTSTSLITLYRGSS